MKVDMKIDVHHPLDDGIVQIVDSHKGLNDPSIVDEAIHGVMLGNHLLWKCGHGVSISDIDDVSRETFSVITGEMLCFPQRGFIDIHRSDIRASGKQPKYELASDAVSTAGDHNHLILDLHISTSASLDRRRQKGMSRRQACPA